MTSWQAAAGAVDAEHAVNKAKRPGRCEMALLLRTLEMQKSPSTLSFAQYREAESQNYKQSSVTSDGELLDVLTLELRVHPPNVSKSERIVST